MVFKKRASHAVGTTVEGHDAAPVSKMLKTIVEEEDETFHDENKDASNVLLEDSCSKSKEDDSKLAPQADQLGSVSALAERTCQRCFQPIHDISSSSSCSSSKDRPPLCQVPHPKHLLVETNRAFGPEKSEWQFGCMACNTTFTKVDANKDWESRSLSTAVFQDPTTRWCYQGEHTTKKLAEDDQRRVVDKLLLLTGDDDLQEQIDSIPKTMPDVKVLIIQSNKDYHENESRRLRLNIRMPELHTLKLIDVSFQKIALNKTLTPKLEDVEMQNIPDDCKIEALLPTLKNFSFQYGSGSGNWVNKMLKMATKLERFDSYKFGVGRHITFASNELKFIRLHRCESLQSLTVYAPRLEHLSLQACYYFNGKLTIEEKHPKLSRELPTDFKPSMIEVEITNAGLSTKVQKTLKEHPRITVKDETEDLY